MGGTFVVVWEGEFPCDDVTDCTPCDEQGPSDSTYVFDLHLLSTNETKAL